MRKFLVLGTAVVALLSLVTIAQGTNSNEDAHVWFFGNCEVQPDFSDSNTTSTLFLGDGCRGIGLFVGDWDNDRIAGAIAYEAMDRFGGQWYVEYLKALNILGGGTTVGNNYGCGEEETSNEPAIINHIGGLWIAFFSVDVCEGYYDGYDN